MQVDDEEVRYDVHLQVDDVVFTLAWVDEDS